MISEKLKSHDWNQPLMEDTTEDVWKKFKHNLHKTIEASPSSLIIAKKSKAS